MLRYDAVTTAEPDPGKCRPGTVELRDHMLARFPGLKYGGGTASGCYVPGGLNDDKKTPSPHGRGRAVDLAGTGKLLDDAFDYAVANASILGIQQAIANSRIWSAYNDKPPGPYTVNPHRDHIHLAQNLDGAANYRNDTSGGAPDMDINDHYQIRTFVAAALGAEANRIIGTLETDIKREYIPAIVAGTVTALKPLLADDTPDIDTDAIVAGIVAALPERPPPTVDVDAILDAAAARLAE